MKRLIIDVREPYEFEAGHVKGAINVPPALLITGGDALHDVPKDTQLVVYCLSGSRSNASIPYLQRLGFTDIVNGINMHHVQKNFI